MKYLITLMLFLSPLLHAEYRVESFTNTLIEKQVPIVDIRTVGEWKETGIVTGSIPIQFFNERGQYDIPQFLKELNANVDTSKEFALICRTGSRTKMVGLFLSDELKYKIIDIQGGIMDARKLHAPIVPYKGN
ncbi:MAG: rhodanese-like domain-containing protein [Helicobacteraceae bacterium]|jgi:rhodanese-related sulfurtransferase|nr:rhodanese-like domain-containing protein [Helicobacteraceae bacterium]